MSFWWYVVILIICKFLVTFVASENVEKASEQGGFISSNTSLYEFIKENHFTDSLCALDAIETLDAIIKPDIWAVEMFDATAKYQSAIITGNFINLGSFSECLGVKGMSSEGRPIEGKYCLVILFFNQFRRQEINFGLPKPIQKYFDENIGTLLIEGTCIPDSCSAGDIRTLFNLTQVDQTFHINPVFEERLCQTNHDLKEFSFVQWFTITLILVAFTLNILCTSYELYLLRTKTKPYHEILLSFSLYSNCKMLYTVRKEDGQLLCINGIRTLSMMWVVLGHKYLISILTPHVNYFYILKEWLLDTKSTIVLSGIYSVDTFFLISGLLVMYVTLLTKSRGFDFSLLQFYLHRIFRLTPILLMTILIYMSLLRYLGTGPLWPVVIDVLEDPCRDTWWKSLLYMQNTQDFGKICVHHSWYLAVDTQLYALAPLLFLPILRWPKSTVIVIFLLTIGSCISGFLIAWQMELGGSIYNLRHSFRQIYGSLWVRSGAWLIGSLLGYCLFQTRGKKIKLSKKTVAILWCTSLIVMLWQISWQTYFYNNEYNRWIASLYYGFSKALWCVCLAWIIFACVHGYGGIVNKMLSNKLFIVIGRLTYSMYMVHVPILFIVNFRVETSTVFSNANILYELPCDFIIILIVAHYFTLSFESPMLAIGKTILADKISQYRERVQKEHENNGHVNEDNNITIL